MSLFNRTPKPQVNPIATPVAPDGPGPSSLGSASQSPAPAQTPQSNLPVTTFSIEDVKSALPSHLRTQVSQQLVDTLNNVASDPLVAEYIRDNFVSYGSVLQDGKFKTEDYLSAVAYVSYKLMGYSNQDAWARTFPARYALLVSKNAPPKDIAAHVSAYNKNKLVNLVLQQTLVPTWVLNQDIYQKAINVQADLMENSASDLVRTQAANSILTHLQKPKDTNLQINIGEIESSGMKEMREALTSLAQAQKQAIVNGEMKTIDVAGSRLIKKEGEE